MRSRLTTVVAALAAGVAVLGGVAAVAHGDEGGGKGNDLVLDLSGFYNPTQPDVYPIVMVTYEIVCSKYPSSDVGQAVKAFLQAAVGPGQADLDKHGYIPLPPDFQSKVFGAVDAITSTPGATNGLTG